MKLLSDGLHGRQTGQHIWRDGLVVGAEVGSNGFFVRLVYTLRPDVGAVVVSDGLGDIVGRGEKRRIWGQADPPELGASGGEDDAEAIVFGVACGVRLRWMWVVVGIVVVRLVVVGMGAGAATTKTLRHICLKGSCVIAVVCATHKGMKKRMVGDGAGDGVVRGVDANTVG